MNIIKQKFLPIIIFILISVSILTMKIDNNNIKTIMNISSNSIDSGENIPINIYITKEKEIRVNKKAISQSEIEIEISHLINMHPKGNDIKGIILHLYLDESISNGYLTDILDKIYSKVGDKIFITKKLYPY